MGKQIHKSILNQTWDVIVVGAGPGGSAAAKMCAQAGLKTLVLEKRKLPREKVCSGLLSGQAVMDLATEIFGPIPLNVLIDPFHLKGAVIHVKEAAPEKIEAEMATALRRDLDYWMIQKAVQQGATLCDGTALKTIVEKEALFELTLGHDKGPQTIRTRFVIGADGAASLVRKTLYPQLTVRYKQALRECYQGSFPGLEGDFIHIFPDPAKKFVFLVNHKGDNFILEASANLGQTRKLLDQVAKPYLADCYGFDAAEGFLWRDGCLEAVLARDLLSGKFVPARGNILLVGDAAGFQMPTAEGIGTALRSGWLAANAVSKAILGNQTAETYYLEEASCIIDAIKSLGKRGADVPKSPQEVAASIKDRLLGVLELRY